MNNGKRTSIDTNTMVKAAFLTAISIVLTRFVYFMVPIVGVSAIRVTFGAIPIKIAGFLFGPLVGGLSGAAADMLGYLINSQGGAYHPGFTISSILGGIIPGLFGVYFRRYPKNGEPFTLPRVALTGAVITVFVSIILNTFWLSQLLGKGFIILLPPRILSSVLNGAVQVVITTYLLKRFRVVALA